MTRAVPYGQKWLWQCKNQLITTKLIQKNVFFLSFIVLHQYNLNQSLSFVNITCFKNYILNEVIISLMQHFTRKINLLPKIRINTKTKETLLYTLEYIIVILMHS